MNRFIIIYIYVYYDKSVHFSTSLIGSFHKSGFNANTRAGCEGASKSMYKVRVKYEQRPSKNTGHGLDL